MNIALKWSVSPFLHMLALWKEGTIVNCWEYKNCGEEVRKTCPAYPESGSACYMITGVKCDDGKIEFASVDEQVAYCSNCGFYAHKRRGGEYCIAGTTARDQ